jgi:hypothetical protein
MKRFFLIASLCAVLVIGVASAASAPPRLNVPIGGLDTVPANPGTYINVIYKWGIGLAALLALARLVFGGVSKVLSAGNVVEEGQANQIIKDGLYGLVLLLSIALILNTINPDLLNIKLPQEEAIELGNQELEASLDTDAQTVKYTSTEAQAQADDSRMRLQAPANSDYKAAYEAMKEEVDEQISREDDDLQEVVGDADFDVDDEVTLAGLKQVIRTIVVDDDAGGNDDFYKYGEKAFAAYAAAKTAEGDGYADAVHAAFNYAMTHMDKPTNRDDVPRMLLLISRIKPQGIRTIILSGRK